MKIEYIVLTVQAWSFNDEKTKELKEGISIHYIDPASKFDEKEKIGSKLIKTTADIKLFDKFKELPGIYEFQLGIESVSVGKEQKVVLQDVEFIKSVDFANLLKGLDQYLNQINNILMKVSQELPSVSDGKIAKDQVPNIMSKLRAKIPELATSK